MRISEAKTKWCPFARVGFYAPASVSYPAESGYLGNRDAADNQLLPGAMCVGPSCMAWKDTTITGSPASGDSREGRCGLTP